MTNGQLPPADWYPDPDDASQLRYWDGELWTEHRHPVSTELPSVGNFLERTFAVAWARVVPCLILTLILGVPAALLSQGGVRLAVGDIAFSSDGISGVAASKLVAAVLTLLAGQVLSIFYWVAVGHQLYWAHRLGATSDAVPTWQTSLSVGVKRGVPALLMMLLIGLVFYAAAVLLVVLAVVVEPLLLLVVVPLLLIAGFWLMIKLAFFVTAAGVKPSGTSTLSSTMQVSADRFWPIAGRLVLLGLLVIVFGSVVSAVGSAFGTPAVDAVALTEDFEADRSIALADLLPGAAAGFVIAAVGALLNLASVAVAGSGLGVLYQSAQGQAADAP